MFVLFFVKLKHYFSKKNGKKNETWLNNRLQVHLIIIKWIHRFKNNTQCLFNDIQIFITIHELLHLQGILSVVSSLELLGIRVLEIILKLCIGFLLSIALGLNYVLSPTKLQSMVCHHISVLSLYHIVLFPVQGGVTNPINY